MTRSTTTLVGLALLATLLTWTRASTCSYGQSREADQGPALPARFKTGLGARQAPIVRVAGGRHPAHQNQNQNQHQHRTASGIGKLAASSQPESGQDLIKVHESSRPVGWSGARTPAELAPESQVVGVHFEAGPSRADAALMFQADKLPAPARALAGANNTKQSQEFETHQQQQQQAGSSSSSSSSSSPARPPQPAASSSTSAPGDLASVFPATPTQAGTTAEPAVSDSQAAGSSGAPPSTGSPTPAPPTTISGWPAGVSSSTTASTAGATSAASEPPPPPPTSQTSPPSPPPGPVGARVDREGAAVLCGEANANGKSNRRLLADRIVGGHKTEPGEFPFQVRLNIRSRRGSGICGGVVLDERHILTAAHCMTACVSQHLTTATLETWGVRATIGDHSIKSDDGELELEVESIMPHEKYDACNFYANDHDIALLRTSARMQFKFTTDGYGSVNRPCMPSSPTTSYRDGDPVIVSGWGVTRENSGALSNILRYVQVPIVNISRCQETYGPRVTQEHVCAGFQAGGRDSCQGDSGGPLVRVVENRYELVGVVSFGYGCGQPGAPGVYTRVASYLDWISEHMKVGGLAGAAASPAR